MLIQAPITTPLRRSLHSVKRYCAHLLVCAHAGCTWLDRRPGPLSALFVEIEIVTYAILVKHTHPLPGRVPIVEDPAGLWNQVASLHNSRVGN